MFSYSEAREMLKRGKNGQKKLANNTYLHSVDEKTVAVRLHDTDIVTIHSNGRYTLNSGGWHTSTTKDRINGYSPARVFARKGVWYLTVNGQEYGFKDGITVDGNGKVVSGAANLGKEEALKAKLDKMVAKYIKGFCESVAQAKELEAPSGGDCWGCALGVLGSKPTDLPLGIDHILEHFKESYYVPSLVMRACGKDANPGMTFSMIQGYAKRGETSILRRQLASYFRGLKPQLMEALKSA